jgi:hypothetical protein
MTNSSSFIVKNLNCVPVINGYNIDKLIDIYSKVNIQYMYQKESHLDERSWETRYENQ